MEMTLTFQGLLTWAPDLFNTMSLPAGVDRDAVINGILLYSADRCVYWSDPQAVKGALAAWSALQLPSWEKMAAALTASYDPLENYDRREEGGWKDQNAGMVTNTGTLKNTGTNTSETSVSAYDAGTYEPRAKEVQTPDLGSESHNYQQDEKSTTRTFNNYRVHGNIGVTTSQQMLQAELELRQAYASIEDYIAKETVSEFTFGVY